MSSGAVSTRVGASRRVGRLAAQQVVDQRQRRPDGVHGRLRRRRGTGPRRPERRRQVGRGRRRAVRASGRASTARVASFVERRRALARAVSGRRCERRVERRAVLGRRPQGRLQRVDQARRARASARRPAPVTASASAIRLRRAAFCERTSASASSAAASAGRSSSIAAVEVVAAALEPLAELDQDQLQALADRLVEAVEQVVEARRDQRPPGVDHLARRAARDRSPGSSAT